MQLIIFLLAFTMIQRCQGFAIQAMKRNNKMLSLERKMTSNNVPITTLSEAPMKYVPSTSELVRKMSDPLWPLRALTGQ